MVDYFVTVTPGRETEMNFFLDVAASHLAGARRTLARGDREGMETHWSALREAAIISMMCDWDAWLSGDFAILGQQLEELQSRKPQLPEFVVRE